MKVGDLFVFIYSNREFHFCRVEDTSPMTRFETKLIELPAITVRMLYPDEGELRQFTLTSQYYKRFEALIKGKGRISKGQVIKKAFKVTDKKAAN